MSDEARCCVPGCDAAFALHKRTFVIEIGGWAGEAEVSSHFCCEHFDMLGNTEPPFLDLTVIGVVRS